jgi:hypothetical protein
MDPIYPWLDPIEVRRLDDRLMKPGHEPAMTVTDAGFDEGFVGYAANQSFHSASSPQPQQVAPAVDSPFLAAPPEHPIQPAPAGPPFQAVPEPPAPREDPTTARGPFLDRIIRFRDWMRHNFSATGIFILDREGAVIFDESSHGRLHFLARSLALASRRPGASGGNVHVKIGAGATLEVIPVDTAYGCLVLGAVVGEPLAPPSVSAVMDALSLVASPPAES